MKTGSNDLFNPDFNRCGSQDDIANEAQSPPSYHRFRDKDNLMAKSVQPYDFIIGIPLYG
jgi:hypothetical protein